MSSVVQLRRGNKKPRLPRKMLGLRAPPDIVDLLDQSANYNFRSVNADIIVRLRKSFEDEARFKVAIIEPQVATK